MKSGWDITETISNKIPELRKVGMDRLEKAAEVIRDEAKQILLSKIDPKKPAHSVSHPPYEKGKYAGKYWTEREAGAMTETIRVVRLHDQKSRNVRIYAGNKKTWWAKQMEFGRGGWKGGRRSFLRPAINKSIPKIKGIIENG